MKVDLFQLRKDLSLDEGVRHHVYVDSFGNKTIGIGHLLPPEADPQTYWSMDQILSVCNTDMKNALLIAQRTSAWKSLETEPQARALVNMAFNLGSRLFGFKTFLSLLSQKKFPEAAEDLRGTLWYKQVGDRAKRICKLLDGEDHPVVTQ